MTRYRKVAARIFLVGVILLQAGLITSCGRGRTSRKPPVHLNPDMDSQEKYKPFRESDFFTDGSAMRQPVPGTIARDAVIIEDEFHTGRTGRDTYISRMPVPVDRALVERGRDRFDIYCSPCHGHAGDGRGIIMEYEYPIPPTSFHIDRLRKVEDGYLFGVITDGIRNMPPYGHSIPVSDRWAIVSYVRALQRSQNVTREELPDTLQAVFRNQRR